MTSSYLSMRGITKWYPRSDALANDNVDLMVARGEIHALVGENGAGKSTLMRVLVGEETADSGDILLRGRRAIIRTPRDARRLGIGMVHQHFRLIPEMTVAENVVLGTEPTRRCFFLDATQMVRRVAAAAAGFGLDLDPARKAGELEVGEMQLVEVLKLLYRNTRLLILDEPTAALTESQTSQLFATLKTLVARGRTIILITHNVEEVLNTADRVTVMRAGTVVGNRVVARCTARGLAGLMVGHEPEGEPKPHHRVPGEPVLELCNVDCGSLPDAGIRDVNLTVREGQIVGVTGIAGSGLRILEDVITGMRPHRSGTIYHRGAPIGRMNRLSRRGELAYVPSQRFLRGASLGSSLTENLILGRRSSFTTIGIYRRRATGQYVEETLRAFSIAGNASLPMEYLSGGNRQKVVLARELAEARDLYVFAEPTWGVDVDSTADIHRRIVALRDRGCAILLISSDLDEVLGLCDRILVMRKGCLTHRFSRGVGKPPLGRAMLGVSA